MPPEPVDNNPPPATARSHPMWLPEATLFSKYETVGGLNADVLLLEAQPDVCAAFVEATTVDHGCGRRRMPGSWGKAMLAFTNSGWIKVSDFWRKTSQENWREWGFQSKPSLSTTYLRLTELEGRLDEMHAFKAKLVQIGVEKSNGHIGHDLVIDGTLNRPGFGGGAFP